MVSQCIPDVVKISAELRARRNGNLRHKQSGNGAKQSAGQSEILALNLKRTLLCCALGDNNEALS